LRASTAASTISIAVPVKRSLAGAVPFSLAISNVVSGCRAARSARRRLNRARVGGIETDIPGIAIEGEAEIGGVAEPVPALQRAGDLLLDLLAFQRACEPRHRDFLEIAGVDADHLVRAQRVQHLRHRQRACRAEIGRAIDRDLRGSAGIVDDVADPHDIGRDVDGGAQRRGRDGVAAVLREATRSGSREERGGEQEGAGDHGASSAEHVGGGLQHLVRGADDLRVHLRRCAAIRSRFRDHPDIGLFEIDRCTSPKTVGVGDAVPRRAGGRGVREQIVADRLQAGLC
jgi:hypothetical protein